MKPLTFLLTIALAVFSVAAAQDERLVERDREITAATEALAEIGDKLDDNSIRNVGAMEETLRELIAGSRARRTPVSNALADVERRLDLLGPPPKETEPPEAEAIAARRSALREQISILESQRTRVLANMEEASLLLSQLSSRRVGLLYRDIAQRGESLTSPALWSDGLAAIGDVSGKTVRFFNAPRADQDDNDGPRALSALFVLFAVIASFLVLGPIQRWLHRAFVSRLEAHKPTRGRRVAAAGVAMIARMIPGLIGGIVVMETARAVGLLTAEGAPVARTLWYVLVIFLLVEGFTTGLFAPAAPAWRLAPIDTNKGRRASFLVLTIVALYGAKWFFAEIIGVAGGDAALLHLLDGVAAVAVGVLLVLLCRRSLWVRENESAPPVQQQFSEQEADGSVEFWQFVRRSGRVLALLIIAAAVAGYVPLADFAVSRIYFFAPILAIAWFVRAALKEIAAWVERRLATKDARKDQLHDEDDDRHILQFWIGAAIDTVLLIAILPIALVLAGVGWRSVSDMALRAFLGFRVGNITISAAEILSAIAVFVGILLLTRFVQSGLKRGPFAHSRLDTGVQNSLTTLIGYAGLLIAFVVGVTTLGFNLSNLAIIAGALSVGIGFGLQSIVNNFVSGLILLFERPIKAGDWIVTTSGEGTVKKISVRSTEIETFDRASIIVPNSELISSTVTNWTHRNSIGRITVPIGVAYHSDPDQVREILLECAHKHPMIVRYPEAFVVWQDFGASSLDFELRAFLNDISKGLQVRTELRFAIFKALEEAGIEIPFPQSDIHVKSLPDGASDFPPSNDGGQVRDA